MPLSEDTKVLVHSRKKVLQKKIVSLHLLDLVHSTYLERTSSVRLHKAQSSVSVIRLLHLVVQTNRLSLQLLITPSSLISLELVQKVQSYFLILIKLLSDLLVQYLISNLLNKVMNRQSLYILVVLQQISHLSKITRIQISSILLERCDRVFLFTLHLGYHQKEIRQQKNTIGVLSLPLQLNLRKIGDQSIQTTRQYPRLQRTGDSYFQRSTTFRLVENIIQTEIHSLLENPVRQTGDVTGIATFLLSEDLDVAAAIDYESSGKSGIATHNAGLFFSGELWLSQAVQHRSFGLDGEFTISGTGGESITPFIPEGSGSLFKLGGAAESSTKAYLVGDYQYLSGTANVNFAPHITGIGTGTFSQGRDAGQTYSRVINHEDDEFGGTLNLTGIGSEVNTESYNESSIKFGQEDEYFGELDGVPAFGFSLGIGNTTLPSFDALTIVTILTLHQMLYLRIVELSDSVLLVMPQVHQRQTI